MLDLSVFTDALLCYYLSSGGLRVIILPLPTNKSHTALTLVLLPRQIELCLLISLEIASALRAI